MKFFELEQLVNTLHEMADIELPASICHARRVNLKKLEAELKEYQTSVDDLLRKYGTTEDGYRYQIPEDKREVYIKEYNDLNNMDVTIEFNKINPAVLDNLTLKAKFYDVLFEFVEE